MSAPEQLTLESRGIPETVAVHHVKYVALVALATRTQHHMEVNMRRRNWRGLKKWEKELHTIAKEALA